MKLKVTPWYPGTVKPVRAGLYERIVQGSSSINRDRWTGTMWRFHAWGRSYKSFAQFGRNFKWRGIMKGKK